MLTYKGVGRKGVVGGSECTLPWMHEIGEEERHRRATGGSRDACERGVGRLMRSAKSTREGAWGDGSVRLCKWSKSFKWCQAFCKNGPGVKRVGSGWF